MDARTTPDARPDTLLVLLAPFDLTRFAEVRTSRHVRPCLTQPIVRALAVRSLAERFAAWTGDRVQREVAALQLMAVTEEVREGADIAAALEARFAYRTDERLVAILDDFVYETFLAHDRLVAAWVAAHGIAPRLAIGDAVRVETNDRDWQRVTVDGEIVGIDRVHAKYQVFSEALGHVRGGPGPESRSIPFEDLDGATDADTRRAA